MSVAVVDASVIAKWFKPVGEAHVEAARELRQRFERGTLILVVPALLFLELLNTAARRWQMGADALEELATQLAGAGFVVEEPPLARVAHWAGLGLTAYDACYVALAEARRVPLITADDLILSVAGPLAQALA